MTTTPFEFINELSFGKTDLVRSADLPDEKIKEYDAFLTNRFFSYFPDTVLLANEINVQPSMPKLMQHDFYLHAVRSRKRFSEWAKKEKDETRNFLCQIYKCNNRLADTYMRILTPEQLAELRKEYDEGGTQ